MFISVLLLEVWTASHMRALFIPDRRFMMTSFFDYTINGLVEQNANLALQIADYGYVLQTGRIALSGPARELLHNPQIRDAYLGGQGVCAPRNDLACLL